MELYGVVTSVDETVVESVDETVVEFFPMREAAEAMIQRVEQDEPELAETLRVEPVEFETLEN